MHRNGEATLTWLDRAWYDKTVTTEEAESFCRALARRHYENFPVLSLFVPRPLRQHFANIYAYCRVSDDLADETGDSAEALARLGEWQQHLDGCYRGNPRHPVFVALATTIAAFDLPKQPFDDLLKAFRQDQTQTRYTTWQELLGYCRYSADPVGRLVLYLGGYRDDRRQRLSDATCTALQLANFWQDVARDHEKGRIYIPLEVMASHGYSVTKLERREYCPEFVSLMRDLIARTRSLFEEGLQLPRLLEGRLRIVVELFSRGGLEVLRAIEQDCRYDTLHCRPVISGGRKARFGIGALLGSWGLHR